MLARYCRSFLAVPLVLLLSCGGGSSPTNPSHNGGSQPPTPEPVRVAVLVLENTDYDRAIGNPAMPWLNQLAQQGALATNYYANTHPSIGNYFMMTTGQTVTADNSSDIRVEADNLVRQLARDNKTWRVYADALPQDAYLGGNTGTYLKRHNPFAYFSDVVESPAQAANIQQFQQFSADLASHSLPDFIYIVPDAVHDAHSCPTDMPNCTLDDRLAIADAWLRDNVAPLLSNSDFTNGVLIITFDEASDQDSSHGGGRIATVLAGHTIRAGFQSSTFYQHQNLLALIGDLLDLSAVPGAAASANAMTDLRQ